MNYKKHLARTVIAAALALPMASANATVINFYNGADLFATLTTSNSTDFDFHFSPGTGNSAAFINELFMDGPNGTFADNSSDTIATATYSLNGYNGGGGGGKIYDWLIQFPQANNATRFTTGEHALWSIKPTADAWELSKVHINAWDGTNSIKLNGCIDTGTGCTPDPDPMPVPGTLLLLGAGILGLRFGRKRTT